MPSKMGSIGPDWTAVEMQEPSHEFESSLENKRGDFRNQANRIITKPGNKTKLKPCSKAKIDELFVTWLSFDKTRDLISSLIENARCGRPLMPLLSPTKQKNQGGHYKVLGSPPLSPSKVRLPQSRRLSLTFFDRTDFLHLSRSLLSLGWRRESSRA